MTEIEKVEKYAAENANLKHTLDEANATIIRLQQEVQEARKNNYPDKVIEREVMKNGMSTNGKVVLSERLIGLNDIKDKVEQIVRKEYEEKLGKLKSKISHLEVDIADYKEETKIVKNQYRELKETFDEKIKKEKLRLERDFSVRENSLIAKMNENSHGYSSDRINLKKQLNELEEGIIQRDNKIEAADKKLKYIKESVTDSRRLLAEYIDILERQIRNLKGLSAADIMFRTTNYKDTKDFQRRLEEREAKIKVALERLNLNNNIQVDF